MKNYNLIEWLWKTDSHEKQSPQRFGQYAVMLIMLLTLGVGQMWAEGYICRSTGASGNQATRTVGQTLGNGSSWNYTFTTNGGWDKGWVRVYVGTSTSSYTYVSANWVSNGSNNDKNVSANIGNVTFDKSGKWYAVGAYKENSSTVYTTTNSTWTTNTTFSMGSNSEPYWTVNPPAVKSGTISISATNTATGSGTGLSAESPIILTSGSASTFTISATQNVSDANSSLYCKFASGSYSSTKTYNISANTLTENQTLALGVKYYNSSASLSGTESTATIYYKWEEAPAVVLTASKTSGINVGEAITLTATGSYASNITQYEFYEGSTKIATVSAPTNTYSYTPTTVGGKTMKVVMTYNSGSNTVTSANLALSLNTPSVSLAVKAGSSSSFHLGEGSTILVATKSNVGAGVTPSYVFTDQIAGGNGVTSASQTGTEWTYNPSATGQAKTRTMKVTMSVGGSTYTGTVSVTVYEKFTVHIKNTDSWSAMYLYMWDGGTYNKAWPGVQQTAYNGSSKWYNVVLDTRYPNFIISQGNDTKKSGTISMLAASNAGNCYTTTTGTSLPSTTCPSAPSVSTNTAASISFTSMTLRANSVSDNSDDITEYGFKYGTTSACTDGTVTASNLSSGSFSKSISGLNVGTMYYFKAYATNAQGTTYGTVRSATTTAATLSLEGAADYEAKTMTITPTTNMTSVTYYVCCSCTTKPGGAADPTITWNGTTKKLEISGANTNGDYTFNVKLKPASNCSGDAFNNADEDVTITMKSIPDYSSGVTLSTAIIGSSYMNGSGTSESPYFVYSSHFNDAKTLTLDVSGVGSSDAVYCAVGGASEQLMTGSGTSRTATITLPSNSIAVGKTAAVTVYAKVDGQSPVAEKKASKTVYYTVNANPVVTVSATYNDEEIVGEIPQNAEITVSASVTNIPGSPTFLYKKGSGEYSSTTTYTIADAGTTTMTAKTSYLGDWTGTKDITTYAANAVTYVTSKTDMYGDVATTSTSRLFKSSGEEHTAAEIAGYTFTGWTCSNSNVQVSDDSGSSYKSSSSNATVYVKATAAGGTLTASYTENKRIYFDNSKAKWSGNIYVYFFNGDSWYNNYNGSDDNGPGVVPRINRIGSGQMTRIGESDIYYYEYGALSFSKVAFSIHNQYNYSHLYNTKGVWRTDFSACNPCYVAPENSDQTKYDHGDNKPTYYYNNGYWRRYMPAKSGYTLHFADQEVAFLPEDPAVDAENFKVTVLRAASTTYPIYVNNSCKSKTWKNASDITKDNCSNLTLTQTSGTCNFNTTAEGDYVFRLSTANGQVKLTVEYPLSTGDYQVYYSDNTGNNNNYSNYIRKNSSGSTKQDKVSFFIKKNATPTFQIKRCTGFSGSTPTWENVGSATAITVDKDSVYNLIFQQNGDGSTISKVGQEYYSGNYYIRTDGAEGGCGNYLSNPDNIMKHTDKASALAAGYNYYYLRWIGDKDGNSTANVKFCIATDYNDCVSQEHGNDPADGSLSGGQALTGKGANVRFTYHPGTNTTTRTCVGGSAHDDQYLVINGTNLQTSGGASWSGRTKMNDLNDWIYTYELKAADDATITLESHYNDKYVTILSSKKVLDVGDEIYYDLRIVYDYKTNEVVAAYIPSTVGSELEIDVDIMFIRQAKDNHESAPTTTLTLTGSGKITGDPKTLYGAIKFEKDYVRGEGSYSGIARSKRSTYWISFPFDVRVKDIFGLGDYTETWILQRYRGDLRASKGWFLDTPTFWEYILDTEYVLKAGEGYVLSLDCEAIQWPNSQTTQYLYFPSKNKVSDITSVMPSASMDVPEHECTITAPADRTIKDANWNVIGIPGFADAWGKATATVSVVGGDLKYFYTWDAATNTLSTTSSRKYNFKFMHSYMVQYYGNIDWSASEPAAVPARRSINAKPKEVEFQLSLTQGEQEADHTFITLMDKEQITSGFDMNSDLVKMENANKTNIYTIINGDVQAAANCLPMTEQTTVVPVGVKIAANGEYTFSILDGTNGVGVTLIDNETGIRTSLSALDYTINLTAGSYENRFVLEISPIKPIATGVEQSQMTNHQSQIKKVLIDGLLYIVKDGKMFDAQGRQVK